MPDELFELLKTAIPIVLGVLATFFFVKLADPLRKLKEISKSPVVSILAAAAVMLAEVYWSHYDGEGQFEFACDWLAKRLGVPIDQVRELVQGAYEALKGILGDEWGALKLGLDSQVSSRAA